MTDTLSLPSPEKFDLQIVDKMLCGIRTRDDIVRLEETINGLADNLGEDPFPLFHKFGAGTYTREVHLPKNHFLIGKIHKHESMVYMITGKVLVADGGSVKILEAPCQFVSKPGVKRAGYVLEDVVWIDIHAVESDNIEDAEKEIFAESFDEYDYCKMVNDLGFTENQVRAISENTDDMINDEQDGIIIKSSSIEGKGAFATKDFKPGDQVGIARKDLNRTLLGRYTNHSFTPNAVSQVTENGVLFIAIRAISSDDEITIDYRDARESAQRLDNKFTGGESCLE